MTNSPRVLLRRKKNNTQSDWTHHDIESAWYRINDDKLELGLSLVRVRCWIYRFINNCRQEKETRMRDAGRAHSQRTASNRGKRH